MAKILMPISSDTQIYYNQMSKAKCNFGFESTYNLNTQQRNHNLQYISSIRFMFKRKCQGSLTGQNSRDYTNQCKCQSGYTEGIQKYYNCVLCKDVIENCDICENLDKCLKCQSGFLLNSNSKCIVQSNPIHAQIGLLGQKYDTCEEYYIDYNYSGNKFLQFYSISYENWILACQFTNEQEFLSKQGYKIIEENKALNVIVSNISTLDIREKSYNQLENEYFSVTNTYWMGLQKLYKQCNKQFKCELRIKFKFNLGEVYNEKEILDNNTYFYIKVEKFYIDDWQNDYMMHLEGNILSNQQLNYDKIKELDKAKFRSKDRDNLLNCANKKNAPGWYQDDDCGTFNLFGQINTNIQNKNYDQVQDEKYQCGNIGIKMLQTISKNKITQAYQSQIIEKDCSSLDYNYIYFVRKCNPPYYLPQSRDFDNNCQCKEGFYSNDFDKKIEECKKCLFQCKSCIYKQKNCLICQRQYTKPPLCQECNGMNRDKLNFCFCKQGFVEQPFDINFCNLICEICEKLDEINCQCNQVVDQQICLKQNIQCQEGEGKIYSEIIQNYKCKQCKPQCKICDEQIDNCLECSNNTNTKQEPDCTCLNNYDQSFYQQDNITQSYVCLSQQKLNMECKKKSACLNCDTTKGICLSCDKTQFRVLKDGKCVCDEYYDEPKDENKKICKKQNNSVTDTVNSTKVITDASSSLSYVLIFVNPSAFVQILDSLQMIQYTLYLNIDYPQILILHYEYLNSFSLSFLPQFVPPNQNFQQPPPIGGLMVALPTMFYQTGIFSSVLIMIMYGVISAKTAGIYCQHTKGKEDDILQPCKRLLGKKWEKVLLISANVYMFLICVLYFLLVNIMLMKVLSFIFMKAGYVDGVQYSTDNSKVIMDKFSIQYLSFITCFLFFASTFITNLSLVVKISQYGIVSLYGYLSFLIYTLITNITEGTFTMEGIEWFSFDLGNLGGSAALAFTMHLCYTPIMKQNKNQKKNLRDLNLAYLMGGFVYIFIGVVGSLGISGRAECREVTVSKFQILDFFAPDDLPSLLVAILYILNLTSCFPIFYNITQERILYQIYGNDQYPGLDKKKKKTSLKLSIIYQLVSFFPVFVPQVKPDDLMSFAGAVCGFIFVYVVPTLMHISCFHGNSTIIERVRRSMSQIGIIQDRKCSHGQGRTCSQDVKKFGNLYEQSAYERELGTIDEDDRDDISSSNTSVLSMDRNGQGNLNLGLQPDPSAKYKFNKKNKKEEVDRTESCNQYFHEDKNKHNKNTRIVMYGVLGFFGAATMIYGIFSLVVSIFSSDPGEVVCP